MNLNSLPEASMKQLTGCDFKTVLTLEIKLIKLIAGKRGRPYSHPVRTMLLAALIKLRTDLNYRAMEALLRIDAVTLSRYTLMVCRVLAKSLTAIGKDHRYLIVDGTGGRVRSRNESDYSGYKHYTGRKVQVVVTDMGEVASVSKCYAGSVHDKRIWNREFRSLAPDRIVLADKGYAGGKGEFKTLFRPIRRNEMEYKADKEKAKVFNRELSKIRVKVEHVFAQLKHYKIISGIFPLKSTHYGMVVTALATVYNIKLQAKAEK